jgi:hypothetical protein
MLLLIVGLALLAIGVICAIHSIYESYKKSILNAGYISINNVKAGDIVRHLYEGESADDLYYIYDVEIEDNGRLNITEIPYEELKGKSKNEQYYILNDETIEFKDKTYNREVIRTTLKL